ncbi:MAG: ATP-binding protein, partial [Chitinispirillaceae bacterium]|nr:ATP-binding protein [Chitinispirillaceae bacterium]
MIIKRMLKIDPAVTSFLWGARQTGKSTLLRNEFPESDYYNLLLSTTFAQVSRNPAIIRERCEAGNVTGDNQQYPIIIDEVQKSPELLDEVHWLMEHKGLRFVLCGSSARTLKRKHGNLLGGRAARNVLHPFVFAELPEFDLVRAINHGLLPPHYCAEDPRERLLAYVGDYLQEEILAEALTRNIGTFNRFLEAASFSNGELVNFSNIARECNISSATVRGYFQILEDTNTGYFLPAFRKSSKRRQIGVSKFYFFDIGIINHLTRRGRIEPGSELFGRAFEHLLFMELHAYAHYSRLRFPLTYWRTASGYEVDFIIGTHEIAVETKAVPAVASHHLKGIRAFKQEFASRRYIVVSLDPEPRRTPDNIEIMPWKVFLSQLWVGDVIR